MGLLKAVIKDADLTLWKSKLKCFRGRTTSSVCASLLESELASQEHDTSVHCKHSVPIEAVTVEGQSALTVTQGVRTTQKSHLI